MRPVVHSVLGAAARFYAPLMVLFAAALLANWPANSGIGFIAGIGLALLLALHMLVFGAEAFRTAFPPMMARLCVGVGAALAFVAAALPGLFGSKLAIEAGLCATTIGASALVLAVVAGRAPTLRDEDW